MTPNYDCDLNYALKFRAVECNSKFDKYITNSFSDHFDDVWQSHGKTFPLHEFSLRHMIYQIGRSMQIIILSLCFNEISYWVAVVSVCITINLRIQFSKVFIFLFIICTIPVSMWKSILIGAHHWLHTNCYYRQCSDVNQCLNRCVLNGNISFDHLLMIWISQKIDSKCILPHAALSYSVNSF